MTIPVKRKIESTNWSGWSEKDNVIYAMPPKQVLESLLVIRIHLEDNDDNNGPLKILPGSHLKGSENKHPITCHVPKGGELIMKPLI